MPAPRFTPQTLAFLRGLKRHNDREWFRARRDVYDEHVRGPMVDIIERLALDFRRFAPELVAAPKISMYRIYRDTRFSADKSPFKTHVAAVFPHRELTKHGCAGFYFHLAPDHVLIGGGIYAPEARQLYRLREHIAGNFRRLRAILDSPAFRRTFGRVSGQRLRRVPPGFAQDHPAADYLKLKQFLAGCELVPKTATGARFYSSLVSRFERLAPFIRFLNEPLAADRPFAL